MTNPESAQRFQRASLDALDEPVRRYFAHAMREPAPLAARIRLTMVGRIKLGPVWLAFTADASAPAGCVLKWQPTRRILACDGVSFPANGQGLDQYAVTVDSKGRVIVDLTAKTGTTPRPS